MTSNSPRRFALVLILLAAVVCDSRAASVGWTDFLGIFVSGDGRVVDNGNGNISHSEGQGYGMLLAEANGDAAAFARIWNWTQKNLQVRNDALLAWKWVPRGGKGIVADMNNATDGDILVSWALFRAAEQWGNESYRAEALRILADVRKLTIVPSSFGPVILPAVQGFTDKGQGITVNLSYWVFPAFRTFAKEDPKTDWMAISTSGKKLAAAAKFGKWKLPPDWLQVKDLSLQPASAFPPDYGYNAVRIPMHLIWDRDTAPENFTGYRSYMAVFPSVEAMKAPVNLATNAVGNDPILPGMARIYSLIGKTGPGGTGFVPTPSNPPIAQQTYFSAALTLLADLAYREGVQGENNPSN